jgi:hypothetical protein
MLCVSFFLCLFTFAWSQARASVASLLPAKGKACRQGNGAVTAHHPHVKLG